MLPALFTHAEEAAFDRIEVTAEPPGYQQALSTILPQQQVLDETSFSSDSLATLLNQAPGINLNGQGGLLQTINIRGFARWRIQTLVEGIPIYTERRAGTAVEFIPPNFVSQAFITPGAASTQLGSGAIGGGIDLQLWIPEESLLQFTYGHNQDHRDVLYQGLSQPDDPDNSVSWQVNHRHGNHSSDANNKIIFDGFEQNSISLRKRSESELVEEILVLHSSANNVAKASADLPEERFTLYPNNTHTLAKVSIDWHNSFIYVHDSKIDTHIDRPGKRVNQIHNEALGLGAQASDQFQWQNWQWQWRTAIDARTGVRAFETEIQMDNNLDTDEHVSFARLNLDAEQWEASVALDANRTTDKGSWAAGTRVAHIKQKDSLSHRSEADTNFSGFIGYAHGLNQHWQLAGYLSSAYRVPSLTERFFNGSTPRGTVLGDASLDTEIARNIEANLSYEEKHTSASIALFVQKIDNYIERLRISSELRQYRNLDEARIQGINYQWQTQFSGDDVDWKINVGGQWLWGEDQNNNPVADITPAQHRLSLSFFGEQNNGFVAITHRQASDEVVNDELTTPGITIIDAGYQWHINEQLKLSLNLNNLTDKLYVTSRDDLAPFARGRDAQLSITMLL